MIIPTILFIYSSIYALTFLFLFWIGGHLLAAVREQAGAGGVRELPGEDREGVGKLWLASLGLFYPSLRIQRTGSSKAQVSV
jgi:hypothetical protein